MANIALYPGGYKPPHIGHYKAAKIASQKANVIVFVGISSRDNITQDMAVDLWKLYTAEDSNIEIRASKGSPVSDVYDYVELEAKDGDTLYFIKGKKDKDDPRFKNIPDYATKVNKNINIKPIKIEDQFSRSDKPVSGTSMRSYIKNNDKESFIDGLPQGINGEAAWNIVTNLEEDLYNPEDKVLDYMKSSEFKAGYSKEDDIEPGYKYRRGGMYSGGGMGYGGMYEDAQYETGKVLHVYDFDDTIAQVKANIKTTITSPSDPDFFQELDIASTEFPEKSKELEARLGHLDITYDFKEFEKQIGDAIVNSKVVNKLKDSLSRSDIKTTILTARSIGHPVTRYLRQELGLDAYVVPLGMQVDGKVRGIDKANWIEKHIKKGYQTIYFIDDSEENRTAVSALKDKYPDIRLKVEDPAAVREMIGMMNNQEKVKHAKNLKRLSKDLKKQGDQYMEVPNYLKGTLTRKMYERELSDKEERIAQSLPDKEFKKRYGKDWKSVKIATATKMAKNEGDTYEKMAAKGKKAGNLKQGTVRKRLRIKDGEKIPLARITKAISSLKKRKSLNDKDKKYLKALNLAKTLKTTTNVKESIVKDSIVCDNCNWTWKIVDGGNDLFICHKCNHDNTPINEGRKKKQDPKKGTGKKPKGSGRRLYTDENPSDTVSVKFSTRQDIIDTLNKASFKSKPHKRQSQIINLIHQRVRAALNKAKDPAVKKRLRSGFEYIKKRKEASKKKTQRMRKEGTFTKDWWKEVINEVLLTEGGAAGHMAHPFNLSNVNNGKQLLDVFKKSADSLDKNPGAIKIDGVNASIRLVDLDGKKQFVMDRGSKMALDVRGITKDDLKNRFKEGHGMIKIGGEVLDIFNEALSSIKNDLERLGAYDNPNILFNMEYVSGKTNVQDYGAKFIAIHGLNEIEGERKKSGQRASKEISYDKTAFQSLLDNLKPTAKKRGYEVYGSVPTTMKKKPNFNSALSKNYTVNAGESSETKSLGQWLNELSDIPEKDFIGMNVGYKAGSSTVNRKKVGAVSKQVYLAILNKENIDGLFEDAEDRKKAVQGFVTYLATEKLGDEVLKVLDSPMGSADKHEGVVIRDESIANVPFKITGKFILGGMTSDF